jgi:16S rRNA processing protein RimM
MINRNEIFPIGKIEKTHGLNGELAFSFTTDVFDTAGADFFVLEMEGIFVPFFIESYRFKSDTTGLIKFDDINSEEKARELSSHEIYLPIRFLSEMDESEIGLEYFIGFSLMESDRLIGIITGVDESTDNALFIVEQNNDEILIPVVDEYISEIDHENRILHVDLPLGLLDL